VSAAGARIIWFAPLADAPAAGRGLAFRRERDASLCSRREVYPAAAAHPILAHSGIALVRPAMTDTLPDRLSVNPKSPFHDADLLARGIGIRFNGRERTDVEEYCVSEGWIRVAAGRARDRHGDPITLRIKGQVVPYLLDEKATP
jgi:uncharacterized protein DUF3297